MTGHREGLRKLIFESDTKSGKLFDEILIVAIVLSVFTVMLDSVEGIKYSWHQVLYWIEWGFTILFTIEYILRLYSVNRPFKYAISFFGLVDLLSILPTYLSLLLPGSQYFLVVRALRVLRIFRILKLANYLQEAHALNDALFASRRKIAIFLSSIVVLVIILGSLMYVIEGQENGFTSIPRSMYWAIVTLTTVGYGDISPKTNLGQALASLVMILGYGIIAVPTGIVTAELTKGQMKVSQIACPGCGHDIHEIDSKYCRFCGETL